MRYSTSGRRRCDMDRFISVVGLGKLGLPLAGTLAAAGFDVIGADRDAAVVEQVNANDPPIPEPGLESLLDRVEATTDTAAAVAATSATFVCVPTPSTDTGGFSPYHVRNACFDIGEAMGTRHLVTIASTLSPGTTDDAVRPALESASGMTDGEFDLAYSPMFHAGGSVVDDLSHPDFWLIGEHNEMAGNRVASILSAVNGSVPVHRTDPTTAEVTKLAVNTLLTVKASYANMLGWVCDGHGADVDAVTDALVDDSRFNPAYLTPGGRYGGPCLPRDTGAFAAAATDADVEAPLAEAAGAVNMKHTTWVAEQVRQVADPGSTVAILGLAYKAGGYLTTESQGVALASELAGQHDIIGYDPSGHMDVPIEQGVTFEATLHHADCAVITVPDEAFTDPAPFEAAGTPVIDLWRLFDDPDVEYYPLGSA